MSKSQSLTTADLVVLSVLLGRPPMHGYELVKTLEECDVEDWASISTPQVYYSLRKMAATGYIIPARDVAPALGPDRIVYKPARKALSAVRTALGAAKWIDQRPPTPFMTWVALAVHAEPDMIDRQFDRRRTFLTKEIAREKKTLISFDDVEGLGVNVARAMVSLVIRQMKAELASLDDLRAAIMTEKE